MSEKSNFESPSSKVGLCHLPGFDMAGALARVRGNEELWLKISLQFMGLHHYSGNLLENYFAEKNWVEAERLVHQIKGSAATIGAMPLSQIASTIETNLKNGNSSTAFPLINDFKNALEEVVSSLSLINLPIESGSLIVDTQNQTLVVSTNIASDSLELDHVMIVDDAPEQFELLKSEFGNTFKITGATNADAAIQQLTTQVEKDPEGLPKVILLDVNMPGTDGYEACKLIKQDPAFSNIDIIFLSANDTTEEILKGMHSGASDYVVKPYNTDILESKIMRTLEFNAERRKLKQDASSSNQLVQIILSETGNLGTLVNFFRSSYEINNLEDLCRKCVESLESLGCSGVVYGKFNNQRECLATDNLPSMLEIELLDRIHGSSEPFVETDESLFVLGRRISLLIRSAPAEVENRGSLKDTLKILLEGADAKLDYVNQINAEAARKTEHISRIVIFAKSALEDIRTRQSEHKKNSIHIMENLIGSIEDAFFNMGLTEAQEKELLSIVNRAMQQLVEHIEAGMTLDEETKDIVLELSDTAQQTAQ